MQQYHFNSIVIIVFSIVFFMSIPILLKDNHRTKLDIKSYSKTIFRDIPLLFDTQLEKKNHELTYIKVKKTDMSLEQYKLVKQRLIQNGWKFKNNDNGMNLFCYDTYISLNILYPTQLRYVSQNGDSFEINDYLTEWYIEYYFYGSDIHYCT